MSEPENAGLPALASDQALPQQSPTESENKRFRVTEIPLLLFRELSEYLGVGEEEEIFTRGNRYCLKKLNSNHKATGFEGAIGIRKSHDEHVIFSLWSRLPEGRDDIFEPEPIFTLVAGPQHGGMWASGRGDYIAENIHARFPIGGLNLEDQAIRLMGLILYRASEIARHPGCVKDRYWEVEHFPDRDYTSDDD